MPSDAKKKAAAARKKANEDRRRGEPKGAAAAAASPEEGDEDQQQQTTEDGDDTVPDSAPASADGGAAAAAAATDAPVAAAASASAAAASKLSPSASASKLAGMSARSTTGVLSSHPRGRDVQVTNFSITYYGVKLFEDTNLELNYGRRYGLIGQNGCGKTCMLQALGERDIPIPDHIDIFLLMNEMEASSLTPLQAVLNVDSERLRLEKEADEVLEAEGGDSDRLADIYERLESLDAATAEMRAGRILHGLGFTKTMLAQPISSFSGGWRMRVALARALFLKPTLLLLDEPTNHLDVEACVWLEMELMRFNRILVIVSHSQDFLNNVCTNIIHINQGKLKYYSGNYDQFIKTRAELEENQMKRFESEQAEIANMKDYIARFGHGSAKLARQAQSKEKVLAKMIAGGLTEKVTKDKTLTFYFPDCGKLPPPVLMVQNVGFTYPNGRMVYKDIDFGIDLDSRIALVGPNGAGKSTLLKMIVGELVPTSGQIRRHAHLRFARFHQHLADQLDFDLSPLQFMQKCFPDDFVEIEAARRAIGRFGLTGKNQVMPIRNLSDGLRTRVIFAWIAWKSPHMLCLDEPTNHLDMETIDSLANAINAFQGGVLLVSHDFRLISQVAKEIWVCDHHGVNKWRGDIQSYKKTIMAQFD